MSVLKDIVELHVSLKSLIFALAISLPFWYFNLYLFHYDFFSTAPIQLPVVAAFCLTIVWVSANFLCSIIWISFFEKYDSTAKPNIENRFLISVLSSVFYTAFLTFIGYYLNLNIIGLLKTASSIILIRFLFGLIFSSFSKKIEIKKK